MKRGLPKCCQSRRFDGSLVRGLRIMLSSPAVVWQKGILPAVCKDTAINWRGLTATHYGAVSLLYYNRYYWWSICKWCNTNQQQQMIKKELLWKQNATLVVSFAIKQNIFSPFGIDTLKSCCAAICAICTFVEYTITIFSAFRGGFMSSYWVIAMEPRPRKVHQPIQSWEAVKETAFYWSILITGVNKIYGVQACQKPLKWHTELSNHF